MEIQKAIQYSPEFGSLKYTDLPSLTLLSDDIKLVTRPVGVFNREKTPALRPKKNLVSFKVVSSLTSNQTRIVWIIRSSGRRSRVINYLFHKWLFGQLSNLERLVMYDLREFTEYNMIYFSALRARSIGYSMRTIRKSLTVSTLLFGIPNPSLERWNGYKTFALEITKIVSANEPLKGKKYSGWKRHQNDQGSLGPQKEDPFYLIPNDENDVTSIYLQICKEIDSGKSEILINEYRIKL